MDNYIKNFIQANSPDGGFLQSEEWRKFQESLGRKTFNISSNGFWANIIEHILPIVGKYFYVPRGPVLLNPKLKIDQSSAFPSPDKSGDSSKPSFYDLIELAEKNKAGWVRIEPATEEILNLIKKFTDYKITKAPHDMQPKEILILDITKSNEELLAEMKQKTRYNIKLSQKHGVSVKVMSNAKFPMSNQVQNPNDKKFKKYIDEFIKLVKITAKRDKITPHPENYYRKMFETIPENILKLYVAEYNGEIIAANLIVFFRKTATYLHGASDNEHRNLMAPYLLQWRAIQDAKKAGCTHYDFGGINTKTGEGITKFKLGFAPNVLPVEFPGAYDIVISPIKYRLYRSMQKIKNIL
jgi:peptidoglycan pentaglycine glycine transferase (the first glycine)